MKKMRLHQTELRRRAEDIATGKISDTKTVAHITPGGGKSLAAAVFARELIKHKRINRVVWICPRTSLSRQAADGFQDPDFNPFYSARMADNVPPLFRDVNLGRCCYTTTYQSVIARPQLHLDELKGRNYLVILDEPHHLSVQGEEDEESEFDEGAWIAAIEPIVEGAVHTLLMTGTIERHDKKKIPFIDYEEDGDRIFPKKDIFYSRYDALVEESIVPIEFTFASGWAEYEDDDGKHKVEISLAEGKEVSKVIQTFLSKTAFRDQLLKKGLDHWMEARKRYPSRAIVACASQAMARSVAEQIEKIYKGVKVALAISEDGAAAQRAIKAFRRREEGDVLVTVGMAYEGLDVPDCKHLVCLTDYRSIPWLEQLFARVTRVDYKAIAAGITYEDQKAYIFVPDDPKMKAVVSHLMEEQDRGIKVREQNKEEEQVEEEDDEEESEGSAPGSTFKPLGAGATGSSTGTLDMMVISDDTSAIPVATAESEKEIRKKIEMLTRRRDIIKRLPSGSTNKLLYSQFGKSRSKMGETELKKVLTYLESLHSNGR